MTNYDQMRNELNRLDDERELLTKQIENCSFLSESEKERYYGDLAEVYDYVRDFHVKLSHRETQYIDVCIKNATIKLDRIRSSCAPMLKLQADKDHNEKFGHIEKPLQILSLSRTGSPPSAAKYSRNDIEDLYQKTLEKISTFKKLEHKEDYNHALWESNEKLRVIGLALKSSSTTLTDDQLASIHYDLSTLNEKNIPYLSELSNSHDDSCHDLPTSNMPKR